MSKKALHVVEVIDSPEAFDRAYRQHAASAFAAARRVLQDDAAAQDVVQDVFLALWRRPGAFDPSRGSLRGYVMLMARSRAVDRYRSRIAGQAATERRGHEDVHERRGPDDDALEPVLRRERVSALLGALSEMPEPQRQAVLASAHGLSCGEIAAQAAIPVGTAKSRIRLGLQRAQATLGAAA